MKSWSDDWGLKDGINAALFKSAKFQTFSKEALKSILGIYYLLSLLGDFELAFPVSNSATEEVAANAWVCARLYDFENIHSQERETWVRQLHELGSKTNTEERLRWALNNDKAQSTLDSLQRMIDDLYALFSPPKDTQLLSIVLNTILHSNNISALNSLSTGPTANPNSLLIGLAQLKVATLLLKSGTIIAQKNQLYYSPRHFKSPEPIGRACRSIGRFKGQVVLVEWKVVRDGVDASAADTAIRNQQRISDLATLLMTKPKPQELRVLPFLGVIKTNDRRDTNYGFVYEAPAVTYATLLDIMDPAKHDFTLGDRYSSALLLCKAMLLLHLAGWLHKGIRGNNVLFYAGNDARCDYTAPYLAGFDYSRKSEADAHTEDVNDDLEDNLYRHPDVQGVPQEMSPDGGQNYGAKDKWRPRFSQLHDIYSLGVVLLEIGFKQSAKSIYDNAMRDSKYGPHSATSFKNWILEHQVPQLTSLVGRGYREAVEYCITVDLELSFDEPLEEAFYINVVQKIESLQAQFI
ncbi:hypothetical protein TWF694_004413 [Orbilia ellipsospora]|uniref:Protein kinase domain-containing protein n=1 Tax=Orbilia ellipsospora TaxID=2528407 RepID=A0AAV9WVC4_9PEZI